jgi:hypothetical protein
MTLPASTYSTHADLLSAAFSYFGIPPEQMLLGSSFSAGGTFDVTLKVALTLEDVAGIVNRAQQLRAPTVEQICEHYGVEPRPLALPEITYEEVARNLTYWKESAVEPAKVTCIENLEQEYNNLDAPARSKYGSRRNYVIAKAQELDSQLSGSDAP